MGYRLWLFFLRHHPTSLQQINLKQNPYSSPCQCLIDGSYIKASDQEDLHVAAEPHPKQEKRLKESFVMFCGQLMPALAMRCWKQTNIIQHLYYNIHKPGNILGHQLWSTHHRLPSRTSRLPWQRKAFRAGRVQQQFICVGFHLQASDTLGCVHTLWNAHKQVAQQAAQVRPSKTQWVLTCPIPI